MLGSSEQKYYICPIRHHMNLELLKIKRKQEGLTLTKLAKELGVSRELMGMYENHSRYPRIDFLESWCTRLGCEVFIVLKRT